MRQRLGPKRLAKYSRRFGMEFISGHVRGNTHHRVDLFTEDYHEYCFWQNNPSILYFVPPGTGQCYEIHGPHPGPSTLRPFVDPDLIPDLTPETMQLLETRLDALSHNLQSQHPANSHFDFILAEPEPGGSEVPPVGGESLTHGVVPIIQGIDHPRDERVSDSALRRWKRHRFPGRGEDLDVD